MWTKLGIASLCLAVVALAYPALHGVIGLGYSDKLNVFPQIPLRDSGSRVVSVDQSHPLSVLFNGPLLFIFELPLFILFFGISGIFLLIHFMAWDKG